MAYKYNPFTNRLDYYEASSGGTVTSVSGTANRITVTNPTTTPVIDIAATYVGQASITTLGTITTGVWNGTVVDAAHGGTGANNTATSGTLLRGNGTTFVPTTATYPATAGTSGNVLTSDGTNWVSSAGGGSSTYFAASLSATQSNVTGDGTIYNIIFDNVLTNVGSAYNNATGVFTAPSNGLYQFCYNVFFASLNGSAATNTIVSCGGTPYNFRMQQYDNLTAITTCPSEQCGSLLVPMTTGQTLNIQAAAFGTTKTIGVGGGATSGYATTCLFSGTKLA